MSRSVTIKDLANRTGTSVASVHRVLHGQEGVSEELREKILKEIKNSGYKLDETASLLRRGGINLAVLLPKPEGKQKFFYQGLWEGIYAGARKYQNNRVKFQYIESADGVYEVSKSLEQLYDRTDEKLHGLITIADDDESKAWLQRFIRRGTKVATVDRGMDVPDLVCKVETSPEDMSAISVRMLQQNIGDFDGRPLILVNGPNYRKSYQIYSETLRKVVEKVSPGTKVYVIDGFEEAVAKKETAQKLRELTCCGIIASCARTTYWICQLLAEMPMADRPVLIGTDMYPELKEYFDKDILKATVYQSHLEHGEKAIQYLYSSLTDYSVPQGVTIFGRLGIIIKENYKYYLP